MERVPWLVIPVVFLALPCLVSSILPVSKPCGDDVYCSEHQYCRPIDHTCQPCNVICNTTSHNFDQDRCESGCQDFLHDERYIRVQNESGDFLLSSELSQLYKGLQRDVLVLKILVGVSLIVISITIASFVAFVIYFWKVVHPTSKSDTSTSEKKTKHVELPTIYNNKYGISHTPEMSPPPSLRESRDDSGNNSASPVKSENSMNSINTGPGTMSTIVNNSMNSVVNQRYRREPSESTLPEYAYDNTSLSHQYQSHHV